MRIRKLGVVGAGTMGAGIAALAASAGIPVVLLDIAGKDGDRNGPAKAGVDRMKKSKPAAFMDVDRASAIQIGNLDTDVDRLRRPIPEGDAERQREREREAEAPEDDPGLAEERAQPGEGQLDEG